jgi:hypothetical protein
VRADLGVAMDFGVMFMDCPEYLDKQGTARCGPAGTSAQTVGSERSDR